MAEFLNRLNTVGASGAVYAILLAFGMLFPNSQMFIFPLPMPIKATLLVLVCVLSASFLLSTELSAVQEKVGSSYQSAALPRFPLAP